MSESERMLCSGCFSCPVYSKGCDAQYRGSRCAAQRAKAGVDFDPKTNSDSLRRMNDDRLADFLSVWAKADASSWRGNFAEVFAWLRQTVDNTVSVSGQDTDREREIEYIRAFVRESDFGEELGRSQLRALWTAYCFHHNLDVDTAGYDKDLRELWGLIDEETANMVTGESDWTCFERFDHYMSANLV